MRDLLVKHRTTSRYWRRYYSAISNGVIPHDQHEFDVHHLAMTTARDAWYTYVKAAQADEWRTRCAKIENTDGTVNWSAFNATNSKSRVIRLIRVIRATGTLLSILFVDDMTTNIWQGCISMNIT